MKAKLLTDTRTPNFLYDVKEVTDGKVTLSWTTRRWTYNETTVPIEQVEFFDDAGNPTA